MENKNIFENAYFDKAYKTRDGRKAVYIESYENPSRTIVHRLMSKGPLGFRCVNILSNGSVFPFREDKDDIVSEWQESINEEELINISIENYPYPDEYADVKRKAFIEGIEWAKDNLGIKI